MILILETILLSNQSNRKPLNGNNYLVRYPQDQKSIFNNFLDISKNWDYS